MPIRSGYCLLIRTLCEGVVPCERGANSRPVIYESMDAARKGYVEGIIDRLAEFLLGEREFGDAMTVEEYIAKVYVHSDGTVVDEDGNRVSDGED